MDNTSQAPDTLLLSSKALHDIRNSLNTILGYTQILQDVETLSPEDEKMHQSIEKAAITIKTLLATQRNHHDEYKNEDVKSSNQIKRDAKVKVLLVDDHDDNRLILELILKKFPLEILHADNGQLSLEMVQEHKPDIIFMDLHMPLMSGIEASKRIKIIAPNIHIIALSGAVDVIEEEMKVSDIFTSFIAKPFDRDAIKVIISKFLASKTPPPKKSSNELYQKILIVDDKEENLFLFQEILEPFHYDIKLAHSGEEALNIAQSFHPDLILLDVIMPLMSGFEVLQELKKEKLTHEIPVIFLTANDTTDDIVRGLEAGVDDYIAKPFHPKELIARVDTHLKKKKVFANIKKLMEYSFHELYTPLSVINSAMQMQELEHERTSYTEMTLAASKTLQNIYDDLYYSLNYSSAIKEKTLFDLSELIAQRVQYFTLVAKSRSLYFKTDISDALPLFLNQEEMERILDNLISNALKYTQESQEIVIKTEISPTVWTFSICNSISKTIDVEKIFQKYFRHDEKAFGLGLGLELVSTLCHKNNIALSATAKNQIFCIKMEFTQNA